MKEIYCQYFFVTVSIIVVFIGFQIIKKRLLMWIKKCDGQCSKCSEYCKQTDIGNRKIAKKFPLNFKSIRTDAYQKRSLYEK